MNAPVTEATVVSNNVHVYILKRRKQAKTRLNDVSESQSNVFLDKFRDNSLIQVSFFSLTSHRNKRFIFTGQKCTGEVPSLRIKDSSFTYILTVGESHTTHIWAFALAGDQNSSPVKIKSDFFLYFILHA